MDPAQVFEVLTTIAFLQISINGETFAIVEATDRQKATVLAASARSGNLSEAKKYYKLLDAAAYLASATPKLDKMKKGLKKNKELHTSFFAASAAVQHPSMIEPIRPEAIVVYMPKAVHDVKKAHLAQHEAPLMWRTAHQFGKSIELLTFFPGRLMKLYWWIVRLAVTMAYGLPLVCTRVLLVYVILGIMAVVQNPGLIIRGLFALLDSFPTYTKYATSAMHDQVLIELNARLPR